MKKHTTATQLRCPQCANVATIHRRSNRLRAVGHRKPLWCYRCKKRTLHTELQDAELHQ